MQSDFSVELGGDASAVEIPWRSNDPHVCYYDLKNHPELVRQIPEAQAYPELGSFLSRINAAGFPLATAKCDAWSSSEVLPEEEIFGDRKFVSYVDLFFVDELDRCSFEKHQTFAKDLCRLLGHAPEIAATVELVIRHCYYHQEKPESDNEAEQSGIRSSATVRDPGINAVNNAEAVEGGKLAHIAEQDDLEDFGHRDEHAGLTKCDELTASSERRQSSPQDPQRPDLLNCDDSYKTPLSGKSGDPQLERKPDGESPMATVTGFCLTIYVTGFGNSDDDPMPRWTIGLNLLQHAIVQLSANSRLKP